MSQEQLEDIQNQIADLSKQLEGSALPKNLVVVLLYKLNDIEEAVKRYKRWGINEFETVYDSLLGGLYKSRASIDTVKNEGVLQKINVFMKMLLGFTGNGKEIVQNAIETTEKITDFLN